MRDKVAQSKQADKRPSSNSTEQMRESSLANKPKAAIRMKKKRADFIFEPDRVAPGIADISRPKPKKPSAASTGKA